MKIRSVHAKRFSIFSKRTNARGRARGNRRIVTKHSVSLDNPLPASPRIRETGLSVISRSESVERCPKNPVHNSFSTSVPGKSRGTIDYSVSRDSETNERSNNSDGSSCVSRDSRQHTVRPIILVQVQNVDDGRESRIRWNESISPPKPIEGRNATGCRLSGTYAGQISSLSSPRMLIFPCCFFFSFLPPCVSSPPFVNNRETLHAISCKRMYTAVQK